MDTSGSGIAGYERTSKCFFPMSLMHDVRKSTKVQFYRQLSALTETDLTASTALTEAAVETGSRRMRAACEHLADVANDGRPMSEGMGELPA